MKRFVIGLGFGDEGKGLVTDWLASQDAKQAVVRYSGGHQVGHTVRLDGFVHTFSNFGSGTLRNMPTIWNAKTFDPVGFYNEYQVLKKYNPKIKVNPNCPITTPYEKTRNLTREKEVRHSTMGVGYGATIEREENHYHLFFQDLFHEELFAAKMEQIQKYYSKIGLNPSVKSIREFVDCCRSVAELVDQDLKEPESGIYESSQGMMLDQEYGIFPYVTRSKLGTQEINVDDSTEYFLVTRGYQTRHGNGYCSKFIYTPNNPLETNVLNDTQGAFKTRVLDVDLLNYAITIDRNIRESGNKNLVITCLDQMEEYSLIIDGVRVEYQNQSTYLQAILSKLPKFKNIYLSFGPTAKDIIPY